MGVSSNALFDLQMEDTLFREKGIKAYREYQIGNKTAILSKGLAFPFIWRYLNINKVYSEQSPVEVVLLSKNSPETGIRIFNSIKHYGLDISRGAFTSGQSPYKYIPAYNISLFLSTNENDVLNAVNAGYPAGRILPTQVVEDGDDPELRVAFDFDGVIADDESERVYQETQQLSLYHAYETKKAQIPLEPGPLGGFFQKISFFQKLETKKKDEDPGYRRILRTAIITARNAPSHERAVNTLTSWGVAVDDLFLLGGIEKRRVLEVVRPHLYMDDQLEHLSSQIQNIPLVHIPFGIKNE